MHGQMTNLLNIELLVYYVFYLFKSWVLKAKNLVSLEKNHCNKNSQFYISTEIIHIYIYNRLHNIM